MGLIGLVKETRLDNLHVAYRPPQAYLVATATYTVFNVRNGPVEILSCVGRVTGAAVGATTVATTFNTVAGDAGAVAINGAVGTVVYIGLNVGAAILNAVAMPKTVATLTTMIVGTQPAGPGLIVFTFGVGTSWTGEWSIVYRKLSPNSLITL